MDEKPLQGSPEMPIQIGWRYEESGNVTEVDQSYQGGKYPGIAAPVFFEKKHKAGREEENPKSLPARKIHTMPHEREKDQPGL